jgi:hypothetical protein
MRNRTKKIGGVFPECPRFSSRIAQNQLGVTGRVTFLASPETSQLIGFRDPCNSLSGLSKLLMILAIYIAEIRSSPIFRLCQDISQPCGSTMLPAR